MKKVYVFVLAVCCGFGAMAQTEKGNWLVGGTFNLNTVSNSTTIGLNPTAGYFVADNFAVGATIMLEYDKFGENKSTTFGAGPLARYYFGKPTNVRPFAHGELNFLSQKFKFPTGTNTENGINYFLGAGLALFLNENVALEGLAGYNHTKIKDIEGDGGFALRIGFQVYLRPSRVVEQIKNN